MADVRLIDANALKEDLKNMLARVIHESDLDFEHSHAKIWTATITGIKHSIKRLDKTPTIDAVPVVRCGECIHRHSSEFCECRPEDAFCSDGEKMGGGAEE